MGCLLAPPFNEHPMLRVRNSSHRGTDGMVEDQKQRAVSRARRRARLGQHEQTRIERANNLPARVCMIGFGIAIVVIAPVVWI